MDPKTGLKVQFSEVLDSKWYPKCLKTRLTVQLSDMLGQFLNALNLKTDTIKVWFWDMSVQTSGIQIPTVVNFISFHISDMNPGLQWNV